SDLAETPTAAYQTTVRQQHLLLTDEADWALVALAHAPPQPALLVERVAHRRELLARCRSGGIESAFKDLLRSDRTTEALKALISGLGSHTKTEKTLRDYQDVLLTDEAVE